jgi:phage FluMu gp28-like protein
VGVDIGRTRDLTVIFGWERIGDVFWCRWIDALRGASFREQRQAIEQRLTPGVVCCVIDKGGIGYQLAEELESAHPGIVQGIQLSAGVQARLAHRLAVAIREQRVRLPSDPDLRRDFRLVRRPRTIGGADRVETTRSDVGHADRFWGAAMGLDAAAAMVPMTPPPLPRSFRPRTHS